MTITPAFAIETAEKEMEALADAALLLLDAAEQLENSRAMNKLQGVLIALRAMQAEQGAR
jgi:hypothetical protein